MKTGKLIAAAAFAGIAVAAGSVWAQQRDPRMVDCTKNNQATQMAASTAAANAKKTGKATDAQYKAFMDANKAFGEYRNQKQAGIYSLEECQMVGKKAAELKAMADKMNK